MYQQHMQPEESLGNNALGANRKPIAHKLVWWIGGVILLSAGSALGGECPNTVTGIFDGDHKAVYSDCARNHGTYNHNILLADGGIIASPERSTKLVPAPGSLPNPITIADSGIYGPSTGDACDLVPAGALPPLHGGQGDDSLGDARFLPHRAHCPCSARRLSPGTAAAGPTLPRLPRELDDDAGTRDASEEFASALHAGARTVASEAPRYAPSYAASASGYSVPREAVDDELMGCVAYYNACTRITCGSHGVCLAGSCVCDSGYVNPGAGQSSSSRGGSCQRTSSSRRRSSSYSPPPPPPPSSRRRTSSACSSGQRGCGSSSWDPAIVDRARCVLPTDACKTPRPRQGQPVT